MLMFDHSLGAKLARDDLVADCAEVGLFTPPSGDEFGFYRAESPPKLLFAKGPVALANMAKDIPDAAAYLKKGAKVSGQQLKVFTDSLAGVAAECKRAEMARASRKQEIDHELACINKRLEATKVEAAATHTLTKEVAKATAEAKVVAAQHRGQREPGTEDG